MQVYKNLAKSTKGSQSGFTMVELMIAIGLSAGLLFGVLQIFDSNRQSARMQAGFSEVQEGGRIGLEMLTRDIRMAGSWGCYYSKDDPSIDVNDVSVVKLHSTSTTVKDKWGKVGVEAFNNIGSSSVGGRTTVAGTDRFIVHGADSLGSVFVRMPYGISTADDIVISGAVQQGQEIIVSDCNGADIFANTASTNGIISHADVLRDVYIGNARVAVPYSHDYFIADNGAGSSSLYRVTNDGNADELVRNVSDMQVTYGLGDDGSATRFNEAPDVTEFPEIVSVRIELTVDSQDNLNGGAPLQKTYLATANVRNKSYVE